MTITARFYNAIIDGIAPEGLDDFLNGPDGELLAAAIADGALIRDHDRTITYWEKVRETGHDWALMATLEEAQALRRKLARGRHRTAVLVIVEPDRPSPRSEMAPSVGRMAAEVRNDPTIRHTEPDWVEWVYPDELSEGDILDMAGVFPANVQGFGARGWQPAELVAGDSYVFVQTPFDANLNLKDSYRVRIHRPDSPVDLDAIHHMAFAFASGVDDPTPESLLAEIDDLAGHPNGYTTIAGRAGSDLPGEVVHGLLTNVWSGLISPWDHTVTIKANHEFNPTVEMTASRRKIAVRFVNAAHHTGPRAAANLLDAPDDSPAGRTAAAITAALRQPHHPLWVLRAVAIAATRVHRIGAHVDAVGRLDLGDGRTVSLTAGHHGPVYLLHQGDSDLTRLEGVHSGDPATTTRRILDAVGVGSGGDKKTAVAS